MLHTQLKIRKLSGLKFNRLIVYADGSVNVADLIDMFDTPDKYLPIAKHIVKDCLIHVA